jgi:hypothetical protein
VRRPIILRDILDASAAAAVKVGVSLAVLAAGFRAISDDDYARLVIAQRFAESPAVDPSRTSWLPLPFWLYGGAFAVFGRRPRVARAVALILGALAAALVVLAARLLGLSRGPALAAGILSAIFPYSAYLGAAVVPEAVASALVVLGAGSLARTDAVRLARRRRAERRLRLSLRALGRGPRVRRRDGRRGRDATRSAAGRERFRGRVVSARVGAARSLPPRRRAVLRLSRRQVPRRARPRRPLLRAPAAHPVRAVRVRAGARLRHARSRCLRLASVEADPHFKVVLRATLCLFALFAALVLGDALGGAPTHHGERALLAVWLWCAVLAAWFGGHLVAARKFTALGAAAAVSLAAFALVRPRFPREAFADRNAEVDIGRRARSHAKGGLAIDTPDYGYFAIQASVGSPDRIQVLDDHDPRKPRAPDVLTDPQRCAGSAQRAHAG